MPTATRHRRRPDVATERKPTPEELRALLFAWTVCKHVKSNAIVYARFDARAHSARPSALVPGRCPAWTPRALAP